MKWNEWKASPPGRGGGEADGEGKLEQVPLKKNNNLLNAARILRRNMTRQEKHLWYDFLRYYPVKIYKQRIIDNFIADFYCHKARLIIEIDGSQHYTEEGRKNDEFRTEILEEYGLTVIRFTNHQINTNFRGVCDYIDAVVQASLSEGGGYVIIRSATLVKKIVKTIE